MKKVKTQLQHLPKFAEIISNEHMFPTFHVSGPTFISRSLTVPGRWPPLWRGISEQTSEMLLRSQECKSMLIFSYIFTYYRILQTMCWSVWTKGTILIQEVRKEGDTIHTWNGVWRIAHTSLTQCVRSWRQSLRRSDMTSYMWTCPLCWTQKSKTKFKNQKTRFKNKKRKRGWIVYLPVLLRSRQCHRLSICSCQEMPHKEATNPEANREIRYKARYWLWDKQACLLWRSTDGVRQYLTQKPKTNWKREKEKEDEQSICSLVWWGLLVLAKGRTGRILATKDNWGIFFCWHFTFLGNITAWAYAICAHAVYEKYVCFIPCGFRRSGGSTLRLSVRSGRTSGRWEGTTRSSFSGPESLESRLSWGTSELSMARASLWRRDRTPVK